ncbi:MAG: endonuclease [Bacteroidota bacterium]
MKQILPTFLLVILIMLARAQAPAGYYNNAAGKTGTALQQALHDIIHNNTNVSYATLWTSFQSTDKRSDGKVWDMYSDIPGGTPPYEFTFGANQCGNYNGEGDCYNREHSWPKSWFGGEVAPMYTDLFHLVPTDGYVNNMRSNYGFGDVGTASWTSLNGSKLGNCIDPGYTGVVFEPNDGYKGDFARNYFYMSTRYYNEDSGWPGSEMVTGSQFKPWAKAMLLIWAQQDPVSQKELDRNNAVYAIQHNRNPFIDHPEYANAIWGTNTGILDEPAQVALQVYPNPVSGSCNVVLPPEFNPQNNVFTVYSSAGVPVYAPFTVTGDRATINMESLPAGFYQLRLSLNSYSTVYKARIIKK